MRRRIDEITEPQQRRTQPHGRAIQRCNQDLRMRVETPRDVQVVRHESSHDVPPHLVRVSCVSGRTTALDVGAGGEEAAGASEDGDGDSGVLGDFAEEAGEAVVVILVHGVEGFRAVEGDDGEAALGAQCDSLLWGNVHAGLWLGGRSTHLVLADVGLRQAVKLRMIRSRLYSLIVVGMEVLTILFDTADFMRMEGSSM